MDVNFINISIFDFETSDNIYNYIYDAGCLHHVKPHIQGGYNLNSILLTKEFDIKGNMNC